MENDAHYPAWSEWFHFATFQYTETTAQKLGEGKTAEIDERQLWKRNVKTITEQVTVKRAERKTHGIFVVVNN